MITEAQIKQYKDELELLKSNISKLQGKLESVKERLKESYKCNTLAEAKTALVKITAERGELETEMEKAFKNLQQIWPLED